MALGMSLLFADDFTPSLNVHSNILYENNCDQGNCAVFMMKNINQSVHSNIVADSYYGSVFELAPYRMPAARMSVSHNILCESGRARTHATPLSPVVAHILTLT